MFGCRLRRHINGDYIIENTCLKHQKSHQYWLNDYLQVVPLGISNFDDTVRCIFFMCFFLCTTAHSCVICIFFFKVSGHQVSIVKFYAPWYEYSFASAVSFVYQFQGVHFFFYFYIRCGHCKRLAPKYEAAAVAMAKLRFVLALFFFFFFLN